MSSSSSMNEPIHIYIHYMHTNIHLVALMVIDDEFILYLNFKSKIVIIGLPEIAELEFELDPLF